MSNRRRNSNNNGSFNKNKAKRIAKKVIALILAFAAGCAAVGAYTALTREKPLNENNLIKYENYFENVTSLEETDKGLKIKWDDDGTFAISGKHADNDLSNNAQYKLAFTQVLLTEGTYMFSSGNESADDDTYGLYIEYGDKIAYTYSDATVVTIDTPTTATVGFFVKNNYRVVYADFEPVLVPGDKAQGFFAEEE